MRFPTAADISQRVADADPDEAPTTPVEVMAAEVRRVGILLFKNKQELTDAGVPESYFDSSEALALVLESQESHWSGVRRSSPARMAWVAVRGKVAGVRNDLLLRLGIVFNGHPEETRILDEINGRTGYKKMLLDISKLIDMGRSHPELLAEAKFDPTRLDAAAAFVHEYARLYAASRPDGVQRPEIVARDKAKAYADDWLQEARKWGKKINKGNPARVDAYKVGYRVSSKDTELVPVPVPVPTPKS